MTGGLGADMPAAIIADAYGLWQEQPKMVLEVAIVAAAAAAAAAVAAVAAAAGAGAAR